MASDDRGLAVQTADGWAIVPELVEHLRELAAALDRGDDYWTATHARRLVADARAAGLLGELATGEPDLRELRRLRGVGEGGEP
jgi:hypothetical protein